MATVSSAGLNLTAASADPVGMATGPSGGSDAKRGVPLRLFRAPRVLLGHRGI